MDDDRLLYLCGGSSSLAAESRYLGLQFASVGHWKVRVAAIDCQGPLQLLGEAPEVATPIGASPLTNDITEKQGRQSKDNGLTAFFVHGGGGRAGHFRHLIHFLAQRGVRCIAPDLPGHGVSRFLNADPDAPLSCSLDDAQCILKASYDALAATHPAHRKEGGSQRRRAVLIGHSFGSLQILRLYEQLVAEERADEVAGICLIGADTAQRPPGKRLLYCRETRERSRFLLQQEREIASKNPFDAVLPILADLQSGAARKAFQNAATAFRQNPSRPPVLLVYGEEDAVAPPASSAACLAAALGAGPMPPTLPSPQSLRLPYTATAAGTPNEDRSGSAHDWSRQGTVTAAVVGRAGHNVMLEQPLETNHVFWEFVRQLHQ